MTIEQANLLNRVSVSRENPRKVGSCSACQRHPYLDDNAPDTVLKIMVGDHERCTTSIRLCDQCWANLILKSTGI